jgi:peptide deformylase
MAILTIRTYPDAVLTKKAGHVEKIDKELQKLIDDMLETMYNAPGIGLAAPQVGASKKLVIIDISSREEEHPLLIMINPEITDTEGLIESEEGCLSVPQHLALLTRAEKVKVKFTDRTGNSVVVDAEGLLARAIQHELDHLEGILIFDRLSPIKKDFFKRKYLKSRREAEAKT